MSSATSPNTSGADLGTIPEVLRPDQNQAMSWQQSSDQNDNFPLLLIFAIAIGLRAIVGFIGVGLDGGLAVGPTWATWSELGESLVNDRSFLRSGEATNGLDGELQAGLATDPQTYLHAATSQPREIVRVPVYGWIVGAVNGLGIPTLLLILFQAVLSGGAASLAFGIVRMLQPRASVAPWIAGILVAVHPAAIGSAVLFVPASIFVVLFLAAIFVAVQDKWDELPVFGLGGLAAGSAVLTLPYGWALAPVLGLAIMVRGRDFNALSRGLVFVACAMIPVGFWMVRNHDMLGAGSTTAASEVFGYYDEAAGLLTDAEPEDSIGANEEVVNTKKRVGQAEMTTRWMAAIREQGSPDPMGAMRLLISHSRQTAGLDRFYFMSQRAAHVATAESLAGLTELSAISKRDFRANRDATTIGRESGGSAMMHHAGTLWIAFNILVMGLAVVGTIRLVIQGAVVWGVVLAAISLHLIISWRPNGDDPMYFAAICLLPILAAAALGYQKTERAAVVTDRDDKMPEFNLYGLPMKGEQVPVRKVEAKSDAEAFAFGSRSTEASEPPSMGPADEPSRPI